MVLLFVLLSTMSTKMAQTVCKYRYGRTETPQNTSTVQLYSIPNSFWGMPSNDIQCNTEVQQVLHCAYLFAGCDMVAELGSDVPV